MVFRPSRVLSCVMFCLDEIVSLSLSKPLRGGLDLLRLVSLGWSRRRSRSPRRSTSLDSPRWGTLWASLSRFPWSIGGLFSGSSSSVALVSVVSLLGGVSLSIPLLWVTLWPSLSLDSSRRWLWSSTRRIPRRLSLATYLSSAIYLMVSLLDGPLSLSAPLRKSKGWGVVLLFMHVSDYDSSWSDRKFHLFVMLILSLSGSPRRRRSTLWVVLLKSKR